MLQQERYVLLLDNELAIVLYFLPVLNPGSYDGDKLAIGHALVIMNLNWLNTCFLSLT